MTANRDGCGMRDRSAGPERTISRHRYRWSTMVAEQLKLWGFLGQGRSWKTAVAQRLSAFP